MISIYALINPITDAVFYIGATSRPEARLKEHCQPHSINRDYNIDKKIQICELLRDGAKPELLILDRVCMEDAAFYENFYTDLFISFGFNIKKKKSTLSPKTKRLRQYYISHHLQKLIGQRFGRLVITNIYTFNRRTKCTAVCDCTGEVKEFELCHLQSGATSSCGCISREITTKRNTVHGLRHHPLYGRWKAIKTRCGNPKATHYERYGGRGVTVCDEWINDFKEFHDWCLSNGWRKGLEIDRYPDQKGDYSPDNCRITTPKKNMNNREDNRILKINGKRMTVAEAAEKFHLKYGTLSSRLRYGWSDYKATHTPLLKILPPRPKKLLPTI